MSYTAETQNACLRLQRAIHSELDLSGDPGALLDELVRRLQTLQRDYREQEAWVSSLPRCGEEHPAVDGALCHLAKGHLAEGVEHAAKLPDARVHTWRDGA
jgi:hypothetical protein